MARQADAVPATVYDRPTAPYKLLDRALGVPIGDRPYHDGRFKFPDAYVGPEERRKAVRLLAEANQKGIRAVSGGHFTMIFVQSP